MHRRDSATTVAVLVLTAVLAGCASEPPSFTELPAADWSHPEQEAEMESVDSDATMNALTATAVTSADLIHARFNGHDRKVAKISIADADLEEFSSLKAFLDSLPEDDDMRNHDPKIERDPSFDRVDEEQRNVSVPAYICAIKFEADKDWHLIVAGDRHCSGPSFFNVEVSGLPANSAASYRQLLEARQDLSDVLGGSLPRGSGYRKYDPPIHVRIEGSTFYDIDHAPGEVGPADMQPETAWEIHPVTSIEAL